jgi:hypothetical protein
MNDISIRDLCKSLNIIDYEIIENGLVNVNDDVDICENRMTKIPLKFNIINGSFNCGFNKLTSLKGGPVKVKNGFSCSLNKLTTLYGAPKEVGGDFFCDDNELLILDGFPEKVGRFIDCSDNELISLERCTEKVNGTFACYRNKLISLKGGPKEVRLDYLCSNNNLITLEGFPEKIDGRFTCDVNPIYEVYRLFRTLERYKASLDYNYWRGEDIVRGRFKKACEDAEIKMPDLIIGYNYIDL